VIGGSDSELKLVDSSGVDQAASDSDIALVTSDDSAISLDLGSDIDDSGSVLSDESGIALTGGSSMTLASESGISLEGPTDSGISLDLDVDEGITLAADSGIALSSADSGIALSSEDSGISLSSEDSGIALSPIDDDAGGTMPMMDVVATDDDDKSETNFDIPPITGESDGEFEFDGDTGTFDLTDEDSEEHTAVLDSLDDSSELGDAVFDVAEFAEFSGEMDFDDNFDEESVEDLDVFEDEEGDFEEGFTAGTSHGDFVAPVSRAAAVDTDWGTGPFVGLLVSTGLMMLVGIVMFDLVRSMWMWNEPTPIASALLSVFGGLYK